MKYITDRIRSLFRLNDTPHRLAAAFALGVFIAFSPTIGIHTVSCLLLAWVFRLSKFVVITAGFINNPWTIVPMYGFCLWIGMKITGVTATAHIAWNDLSLGNAYMILRPYLWPFVAGTLVTGAVASVVSYGVVYWAIIRYRKQKEGTYSPADPRKLPEA